MVKKEYLVLIAAFVWMAAGINIMRLGIAACLAVRWEWWMIVSLAAVFLLFGGMFFRIVGKHTRRIYGYDQARKHLFLKFFDIKAYILMAVMMTGGILMRTFHWIPDRCTAMFYTGLGGALTCAGIFFLVIFIQNFLREKKGKMDQGIYKNYLKILKEELLPATGCTEPIAVAYAAAVARDLLGEEVLTDRSCLTVENIFRFANEVALDDIKPVLSRQIEYNMAIAEEGLKNQYGANIGKVLLRYAGNDVNTKARAYAAAGSDARMNGCEKPVVIISGSGNQGITASVPVIVYAKELGKSEEQMLRALVLSDLVTIHLKTDIGRLSAYCGAVSAGVGAGAGICYLCGGGRAGSRARTLRVRNV